MDNIAKDVPKLTLPLFCSLPFARHFEVSAMKAINDINTE